MVGSIAPIPKDGTGAASPGPDMPDWSIGRGSRHYISFLVEAQYDGILDKEPLPGLD